jgi:hypothetical protein
VQLISIEPKPRRLQGVGNRQFHNSSAQRAEKGARSWGTGVVPPGISSGPGLRYLPPQFGSGAKDTGKQRGTAAEMGRGDTRDNIVKGRDANRGCEKDAESRVDESATHDVGTWP